jgi:ABC-2 type transport system permease protein
MIPAVRAEFRKLFSVRSTYFIMGLCLAVILLFALYIDGYRASATDALNPGLLASMMTDVASFLGLFIAFGGVLLMTHEYRYTTIMYTLTAARSRSHVLLAKFVTVSVFAILLTVLICLVTPLLAQLGIHAQGLNLVAQSIPYRDVLGHAAFYGWGYSMFALIAAVLLRNMFGTLGFMLLFPGLGETLLGLLLKGNAKYLPFNALSASLQATVVRRGIDTTSVLSQSHATLVALIYMVGGGLVAWILFLKRDAN